MEQDILKQFKLPSYIKGKTFAQASKSINDKFKGRNDKMSVDTKKELLTRLSNAQEFVREQNNPQPQEGQEFAGGGIMGGIGSAIGGNNTTSNPYVLNNTGYMDPKMAQDTQNNQMVDKTKDIVAGVTGPWGQLFRGIQKGGQSIGNAIGGDVGAGVSDLFSPEESTMSVLTDKTANTWEKIGGTVPILGGVISKRLQDKRAQKAENRTALGMNAQYSSDFAYGGKMYNDGGDFPDPKPLDYRLIRPENMWKGSGATNGIDLDTSMFDLPESFKDFKAQNTINKPQLKGQVRNDNIPSKVEGAKSFGLSNVGTPKNSVQPTRQYNPSEGTSSNKNGNVLSKVGDFAKDNYADILRYAPALANALQLSKLKKPKHESRDRLGNRYNKDLVDESALRDSVQQEADNTRRAILGASGGFTGAAMSNLLGMQLNSSKALSDAMLNAEGINRGENQREQQFNLGVDGINLRQSNLEKEVNARNQGVYDTNKSALIAQLGDDIGNVGKEQRYKQMVKEMGLCYDARGRYICGTDERVPDDVKLDDEKDKAYGGEINHNTVFTSYLDKLLKERG